MAGLELLRIRRVLVGLSHDAAAPLVATAAQFARALDAELYGLFIEDAVAFAAAALPLGRAIAPHELVWRALEPTRLTEAHDLAARGLQRRVMQEAAALGVAVRFEVARGDPGRTLVAHVQRSDLVVVAEPADPIARSVQRDPGLVRAALQTAAAVLYLPPAVRGGAGPVVALAGWADDPAAAQAAQLAAALGERCVVLTAGGPDAEAAIGDRIRADAGRGSGVVTLASGAPDLAKAVLRALQPLRERLLVVSRARDDGDVEPFVQLAAQRGTPLLVLER